jgi:type I restriction enzyme S subunit
MSNYSDWDTRWRLVELKRLFRVVNGSTPKSGEEAYWGGEIFWATPDDLGRLKQPRITTTSRRLTRKGLDSCGASVVPTDSIVISTRAPIGHLALAGIDLCTNQGCRSLRAIASVDSRYFYYALCAAKESLQALGQGTTFRELPSQALASFHVPAPTLAEQRSIADFLDRKTEAIDQLIAKKERLIDLLQEKRQALIARAVTKGLDPDVPMKDSGIEWLGAIPEHWTTKRLKHLGRVHSGLAKGRKLEGPTVSLPYLRVANVQDGYLDLNDIAEIDVLPNEIERYSVRSGDVLMNEGGDNDKLGRGAVWRGQVDPCLHQNHVFVWRPHLSLHGDWVALCTQSSNLKYYFQSRSKQSTNLASISSSNLKEATVPLPPDREIEAILSVARSGLETLQWVHNSIRHQIDLLREYRQALITEAVTGKLDVTRSTDSAASFAADIQDPVAETA